MEPQLVLPIDSPPQLIGPWPRVLKIIAIATLHFSISHVAGTGAFLYSILMSSSLSRWRLVNFQYWNRHDVIWAAFSLGDTLISLVMTFAALNLFRHHRGHRLLSICTWIWLTLLLIDPITRMF